jgi:hypothetical protein
MYGYEVSLVDNENKIGPLAKTMSTGMVNARGLPGYTFERAAGGFWRSRFDAERNLILSYGLSALQSQ